MDPDQRSRASALEAAHPSQTLAQPLAILLGRGHLPQPPGRTQHKGRQQRRVIEKQNHALQNFPSHGLTLK